MQIQLGKTLDVEVVERELAELWQQTAGDGRSDRDADDQAAVLRARVANLIVFVPSEAMLGEVQQMLAELTAIHPSRVLLMLGQRGGVDTDIEMSVESFCQTDKHGAKRLCCEEVALKAAGNFAAELPSAALPLLVPDLATFLWWRDSIQPSDKVFRSLLGATDRLVIDSAEFANPENDLLETNKLFDRETSESVAISDLNWARLTFWRTLLADFYDVPSYQPWLDRIDHVRIDYVAPEPGSTTVAPQAWLIAGWLASRLGWSLKSDEPSQGNDETLSFKLSSKSERGSLTTREGVSEPPALAGGSARGSSPTVRKGSEAEARPRGPRPGSPAGVGRLGRAPNEGFDERAIRVEFHRVERGARKPGRLVRVELRSDAETSGSVAVTRSPENLHLLTETKLGANIQRGRVLPVRNRSAAQLLSREMEILCNDQIYQEALAFAATLIERRI